ncbi:MAG TPA: transcription antitermination factor NusB [Candidatus Azoamicus sp. MARI]
MKKVYKKRRRSRQILLQILYSLNFFDVKEINFKGTVIEMLNKNKIDFLYLDLLLSGMLKKKKILDIIIEYNFINYKYFNILDKIIVKMAIFDIFFNKNVPLKVIVNEAIELSKIFSSKGSYIFINKILNNLIKGYIFNVKFLF